MVSLPIRPRLSCRLRRSVRPTLRRKRRPLLLDVELHVAQVLRRALDGDGLAVAALLAAAPAALVVDEQPVLAAGRQLDLEVAVLVGDREIRVVEDADAALHP